MLESEALETHLDAYLASNTAAASIDTHTHYRRSLRRFSAHLGRPAAVGDLVDANVAAWLAAMQRSGLSAVTANQNAKQILALWRWLAKQRLTDWPTVRKLREPEPLPRAWTRSQLTQLFNACKRADGWIAQHRACDWWLGLHWFLYDTAERIGATLQLRRAWLDLEARTASIPAAARKGGQKSMVYRLRPKTCDCLAKLLAVPSDSGLVFDSPWKSRQSIYKRYRKLIESAGLPWDRRVTGFHQMRRLPRHLQMASACKRFVCRAGLPRHGVAVCHPHATLAILANLLLTHACAADAVRHEYGDTHREHSQLGRS